MPSAARCGTVFDPKLRGPRHGGLADDEVGPQRAFDRPMVGDVAPRRCHPASTRRALPATDVSGRDTPRLAERALHIMFGSAADPTRRYEMHNSIQWLGRSGATHECDVSVLPETVAGQLRSAGGRPQGLPIAMFECKDKPKAANVDELRQTLARMFDLALVTLPAPGIRCRIYEAVTPRGWGSHHMTYIDFFASGAFGQVRAGGFSTGSISLGVHYRIARMGDIYTNPGSLRLGTVRFVEALDNAHL